MRAKLLRDADGSPGAWGDRDAARVTPPAFSEAAFGFFQRSEDRNGAARRLDDAGVRPERDGDSKEDQPEADRGRYRMMPRP